PVLGPTDRPPMGGPPEQQDPKAPGPSGVRTTGRPCRYRLWPEQEPGQEYVRASGNARFYGPKGEHYYHRGFRDREKLPGAGPGTSGLYDGIQDGILQYRQTAQKTETLQSGRHLLKRTEQTTKGGPVD